VRILIATAGELSPGPVAEFVERIPRETRRVVVATVIEVPRSFLDKIKEEGWHPLGDGGDATERTEDVIARYVDERGARITDPVVAALRTRDIDADTLFLEGVDPAATIVAAAEEMGAELLVVGATKRLFDETHWESITARVIRDARRPVLVIPPAPRDDTGEIELDTPTSEFSLDA
jgi:nucleotide-binding universal stress UspA family protein